jgi:RDD family
LDTRIKSLLLTPVLLVATLVVGWLVWSVAEWRHGSTPSYGRIGLRVVRRSDGRPIGLWRSVLRELCLLVLLVPTLFACSLLAVAFVMGASPPDGVLRQPRTAPWDWLTRTEVVDEFGRARGRTKLKLGEDWPIDPSPVLVRRSGEKWRQN